VYWKPVYYLLEDDFELWLVNAQHVKNVPGRKTHVQDAQWLCQLLEHGLVRASFVPPKPFRELRDLTRYRKSLTWERSREANRLQSSSRTRTSSSPRWRRECWAHPGARCSTSFARETTTQRRSLSSPRASCGKSCRRFARRSRAASHPTTPCSSRTCSPTSITSTRRSARCRPRSRSVCALSSMSSSCSARSPASGASPPR